MIDFNNKKVQYVILAALLACAFFFVLLYFVILPQFEAWKQDSAKTLELNKKVSEMRNVVQSGSQIQKEIEAARASIKEFAVNIPLPVLGNYLLGMEKYVRECSSAAGVDVDGIVESDIVGISSSGKFKVYRVRVQSRCGYGDFVKLATVIQAGNPLVSVSGLNIAAREATPTVHEISFVVAWMVWADPAKRPEFLTEKADK